MSRARLIAVVGALALLVSVPLTAQTNARQVAEPVVNPAKGAPSAVSVPEGGCVAIPDNAYDGTIGSMVCTSVPGLADTISDVDVNLSMNHTWAGDITVKVVSPSSTQGVMSLPGLAEPADDGASCCGNDADLFDSAPITFDDAAGTSAEDMGASGLDVCSGDGICSYSSAPDSIGGGGLAAFNGEDGTGMWQICVGDSAGGDTGDVCDASLIFNGLASDLSIAISAPDGVADDGPYTYLVEVTNGGGSDNTNVAASVSLPTAYLSDDCGGSVAGTWNWAIGALSNGATISCTITVDANVGCSSVVADATVTGDLPDPVAGNNADSHTNGSEAVLDPGFETGSPNAEWSESSSNFGTPLCTIGGCGTGGGTGPNSGDWWAWFGGIAGVAESGSVSQSVTIPVGVSDLTFWLEIPSCDNAGDFMELTVDGDVLFTRNGADAACGVVGYVQHAVDISGYADGGAHTVAFNSTTNSVAVATNFFVDDVSISGGSCQPSVLGGPPTTEIPTLGEWGLLLLLMLLAGAGVVILRR